MEHRILHSFYGIVNFKNFCPLLRDTFFLPKRHVDSLIRKSIHGRRRPTRKIEDGGSTNPISVPPPLLADGKKFRSLRFRRDARAKRSAYRPSLFASQPSFPTAFAVTNGRWMTTMVAMETAVQR